MEIYNLVFEYIYNAYENVISSLNYNYEHAVIMYSILSCLIGILYLNKRFMRLEKIQFNDIDDITSYNRLIDEEIGMLKQGHDNLSQELTRPNKKIENSSQNKLFENAPYTQAVQLAKRGYARDDIISLCSLTESEVELILALHSGTKAA